MGGMTKRVQNGLNELMRPFSYGVNPLDSNKTDAKGEKALSAPNVRK